MNTNNVTQAQSTMATAAYGDTKKTVKTGKTIGDPKLSEKAEKYYEQLKKKFSNMDFILVSEEKKAEAEANAAKYANANRMVVLIDTEKIEKMAQDEAYRKKYEGIISGATTQFAQMKTSLGNASSCVKTYGMKFDDGGNASFFAVIDKSLAAQKKRIEKNASKKVEEKKNAAKKAQKKREEKRKAEKESKESELKDISNQDTVTVQASSMEELIQKIKDIYYYGTEEPIQTEEEKNLGQHVNYSI